MINQSENHSLDGVPKHIEEATKKPKKQIFSSRSSVLGTFAILLLILTIPITVLLTQQRQDLRQRASEISPTKAAQNQSPGSSTISGYVFTDTNKNGERDTDEKAYKDAIIVVTKITKIQSTNGKIANNAERLKTDENGYFKYKLANPNFDNESYIVKLELPKNLKTINTNPIVFTNFQKNSKETVDFGLFPIIEVVITPVSSSSAQETSPTP